MKRYFYVGFVTRVTLLSFLVRDAYVCNNHDLRGCPQVIFWFCNVRDMTFVLKYHITILLSFNKKSFADR